MHKAIDTFGCILFYTSFFQYVTHVKCEPGVDIDYNQSMYPGCDCASKCDETSCACIVRYGPNYDKQRRLLKTENSEGTVYSIL